MDEAPEVGAAGADEIVSQERGSQLEEPASEPVRYRSAEEPSASESFEGAGQTLAGEGATADGAVGHSNVAAGTNGGDGEAPDVSGPEGGSRAEETLIRLPDGSYAAASTVHGKKKRRRWPWVAAAVLLSAAGGGAAAFVLTQDDTDEQYLAALEEEGFGDLYAADRAAISHASEVCNRFDAGEPVQGYASERIAVEYYCADYLGAYEVIPTPEERAEDYYEALQEARLTGQFSDQPEAVTAAERLCGRLDEGEAPQGFEVDKIGVEHYCPDYAERFRILEQETITGTFTIFDSDPNTYFPSIESLGSFCYGSGGYGDLNSSTAVLVKSESGETLARTELGLGTGGYITCKFEFSADLTEGEDAYILAVGDRGEISYTWSEITRPGAVALTIGD